MKVAHRFIGGSCDAIVVVRETDGWFLKNYRFSVVRFTDLRCLTRFSPALKRWAILIQSALRTDAKKLCENDNEI